jgi:hypothetical protein
VGSPFGRVRRARQDQDAGQPLHRQVDLDRVVAQAIGLVADAQRLEEFLKPEGTLTFGHVLDRQAARPDHRWPRGGQQSGSRGRKPARSAHQGISAGSPREPCAIRARDRVSRYGFTIDGNMLIFQPGRIFRSIAA